MKGGKSYVSGYFLFSLLSLCRFYCLFDSSALMRTFLLSFLVFTLFLFPYPVFAGTGIVKTAPIRDVTFAGIGSGVGNLVAGSLSGGVPVSLPQLGLAVGRTIVKMYLTDLLLNKLQLYLSSSESVVPLSPLPSSGVVQTTGDFVFWWEWYVGSQVYYSNGPYYAGGDTLEKWQANKARITSVTSPWGSNWTLMNCIAQDYNPVRANEVYFDCTWGNNGNWRHTISNYPIGMCHFSLPPGNCNSTLSPADGISEYGIDNSPKFVHSLRDIDTQNDLTVFNSAMDTFDYFGTISADSHPISLVTRVTPSGGSLTVLDQQFTKFDNYPSVLRTGFEVSSQGVITRVEESEYPGKTLITIPSVKTQNLTTILDSIANKSTALSQSTVSDGYIEKIAQDVSTLKNTASNNTIPPFTGSGPSASVIPVLPVGIPAISESGESFGSGCPAPAPFLAFSHTFYISFDPLCTLAGFVRPLFISAAWFIAAFVLYSGAI